MSEQRNGILIKDKIALTKDDLRQDTLKINATMPAMRGILYESLGICDDFGNPIIKKVSENTVVLGGAVRALEQITGLLAPFKPSTLNAIYNLNPENTNLENTLKSFICLFGVGVGGSNIDFGSVINPSVKQREIMDMIPIRYGDVVSGQDINKYRFKKLNSDDLTYSWYLKEFDTVPVIKSYWKDSAEEDQDGTEISTEVYNSTRLEGIESFVEFKLILRTMDVREYYSSIGELDMARYNSIGLFTGYYDEDINDYRNVHLFSVTNFENRSVKTRQESTYYYRLYSLV